MIQDVWRERLLAESGTSVNEAKYGSMDMKIYPSLLAQAIAQLENTYHNILDDDTQAEYGYSKKEEKVLKDIEKQISKLKDTVYKLQKETGM